MDNKQKTTITASIDIIVSILIIIAGFVVLSFWAGFSDFLNQVTNISFISNMYSWLETAPWIAFFSGLVAIVYGLERLIINMLKFV